MKIETTILTVTRENVRSLSRTVQPHSSHTLSGFSHSRSLEMSLAAVPDVRASEVARGKALVADPSYPSKAQIKQIARVLVAARLGR